MRALSRDMKTTYYKYQSLPRNFTQEKRLKELHTLKEDEVKVGIYKYSTKDDLGKGYSSKVYKGVEIEKSHKRYAIKVIELKKFRGSNLEMLEAQIDIHKALVHDNVVRLYQVIKTPYFFYIIMEYCPHGNLHQYIKQKKKLSENNAIEIMEQVLAGTRYLIEQGIIHRDLKPANILRVGNKWKISDFGFAVKSRYGFKDRINVGTPLYMSPESLKKSYYSAKTDIFALGVILYEMVEGHTPWQSKNEKELMEKIKDDLVMPATIRSEKIKEFIQRCCELNESKRMSKQELLEFVLLPKSNTEGPPGSERESMLAASMSRAVNHTRRPSILSDKNNQDFAGQIEFLYNEFLFAKHLYSCVRNFQSFLLDNNGRERLILVFFKLLLKLIRFLSDKKVNHFKLPHWEELTSSKPYRQLYQHIVDQAELFEKEYLEQIKLNDIKNIRIVNKKFPDLCHHNLLPARFYESLQEYLITPIRQHNHQTMLLMLKEDRKVETNNTETATSKPLITDPLFLSSNKIQESTHLFDSQKKYQIKPEVDAFPHSEEIIMAPLMAQPKKQSRLVAKILSKRESQNSNNGNRNSKAEDEKKSTKNSDRGNSTLQDKYQALESLYTIYRVTELRCVHQEQKEIAIEKIKVVENFLDSKLQRADYIDLRRLLRSL